MTCGKFYVQSCGLLWFLSTVYLVYNTLPKRAGAKRQADFNLIVQRPRVAGGTLTIPIDSTVRVIKCSSRDGIHHTIRLRYGPTGSKKSLVMRASSSLERGKWLDGILAAKAAIPISFKSAPTSHTSPNSASSSSTCSSDTPSSRAFPSLRFPDSRHITSTNLPKKTSAFAQRQGGGSNTHQTRTNSKSNATTTRSRHSLRQRAQQSLSVVTQFLIAIGQAAV